MFFSLPCVLILSTRRANELTRPSVGRQDYNHAMDRKVTVGSLINATRITHSIYVWSPFRLVQCKQKARTMKRTGPLPATPACVPNDPTNQALSHCGASRPLQANNA